MRADPSDPSARPAAAEPAGGPGPECPPWCGGDHDAVAEPRGRLHLSDPESLPVVYRSLRLESGVLHDVMTAASIDVGLLRREGESDTWLALAVEEGPLLELSVESAARLLPAVQRVLLSLRRPPR